MRLSIAMCTYNGAQFLEAQLQSFLEQSVQPDELIVFDDCSGDNTVALLEAFQQTAPFTVEIFQNEHNVGSSINFGNAIAKTTGDIIFLADQDDVWLPHKLERMRDVFVAQADVGVVYSDAWIVDQTLQKTGQRMWQTLANTPTAHQHRFANLLHRNYLTGAMMAFRASLNPIVLPISRHWVHDYWIALLAVHLTEFYALNEPTILYRQHNANQIGLTHQAPVWQRMQRTLKTPVAKYQAAYEGVRDLVERIREHDLPITEADWQALLTKQKHWQIRAELPHNFFARSRIIAQEVAKRNYQRYSKNGLASAARDWLAYFFDKTT